MSTSFFLYGERGIGKTALASLILHIAKLKDPELHDLNLVTSYYAVEKEQEIDTVLQESINVLTDSMEKGVLEQIGSKLGNLFKNGKFQIGSFSFEGKQEEKKAITIKDQAVSILSNIIKSFCIEREGESVQATILQEEKNYQGILIIIDEIHNIKNIENVAVILRNIITTLTVNNLGKISFLLIGYEDDVKKFLEGDSSSRRFFDLIELETMPDRDAAEILQKGFMAAKKRWDSSYLIENIKIAGGYPHSIQILGHNLIKTDYDNYIDENDWAEASLQASIELGKKDFSPMYSFGPDNPLNNRDKILKLLVVGNKEMSRKQIAEILKKNIYQDIPILIKTGAIKETPDKKIKLRSQLLRTAILIDLYLRSVK
jgi:hypothetical protein